MGRRGRARDGAARVRLQRDSHTRVAGPRRASAARPADGGARAHQGRPVEAVIRWEQAMGSAAVTRHDGASRREMTGLSVHHACCSTKSERGIFSVIKHTTCTSICFRWRRWWWCWWWGNPNSQWEPENKPHTEENEARGHPLLAGSSRC